MKYGNSLEEKEDFLLYCRDHYRHGLPFPGDTLVNLFHLAGKTPPDGLDSDDVWAGQFFPDHALLNLIFEAEQRLASPPAAGHLRLKG